MTWMTVDTGADIVLATSEGVNTVARVLNTQNGYTLAELLNGVQQAAYTYDAFGDLVRVVDAAGRMVSANLNPRGQWTSITQHTMQPLQMFASYTTFGQLKSIVDATGLVTSFSYPNGYDPPSGSENSITKKTAAYAANGVLTSSTCTMRTKPEHPQTATCTVGPNSFGTTVNGTVQVACQGPENISPTPVVQ